MCVICAFCTYMYIYVLQWSAPATDSGRDPGWLLRVKRHLSVSSDKHVHVGQYTITSAYMVVCDLICARRLYT